MRSVKIGISPQFFVNYIKGEEMDKYVARMQKTGNVKERGYLEKAWIGA